VDLQHVRTIDGFTLPDLTNFCITLTSALLLKIKDKTVFIYDALTAFTSLPEGPPYP